MGALLATLFIPLAGAVALMFYDRDLGKGIRYSALAFSLVTFVCSLFLWFAFDSSNPGFQFVLQQTWIPQFDAGFRIGLDGMSLLIVMLTTFIMPIAILASFNSIQKREKEYYIMMLLLQFGMTGVFVALDTFLFYVFWEVILIPMYFLIGIWGGQQRIYAAIKFFLYTMVGSLLMLVAIIWLGMYAQELTGSFTTNLLILRDIGPRIPAETQQNSAAASTSAASTSTPA